MLVKRLPNPALYSSCLTIFYTCLEIQRSLYFSLDALSKTRLCCAVMENRAHIYLPTERFSRRL